jgi:uncharacterized membrane protein HdeD (DUF308 family)
MEFLNEYMVAIVVGICLIVGFIIKHVIASEKVNRFIPLMMGILGVVVNAWVNAWAFTPEILLAGLISGLASTGMHQAFKQLFFKEAE